MCKGSGRADFVPRFRHRGEDVFMSAGAAVAVHLYRTDAAWRNIVLQRVVMLKRGADRLAGPSADEQMGPQMMFRNLGLAAILTTAATATTAVAQPAPQPEGSVITNRGGVEHTTTLFKTGRHLNTVTCAQFNALDESFKPQAITYAANYGPKGHAHPTATVSGVERFTPDVITACRARPGDHLLPHVRSAMTAAK